MYGSASTWTYNAVCHLASAMNPDRPVVGRLIGETDTLTEEPAEVIQVVKSHAPPAAGRLAERADAIFITIRDPRDAVASMMAHSKWPFDYALHAIVATAHRCALHVADSRVLLLRFEDRFFDRIEALDAIASRLPGTLSAEAREAAFAATRREAIERFIAGLEDVATVEHRYDPLTRAQDTYDTVTHWHRHHAGRTAETGRWRRSLAPAQVTRIESGLLPWMDRFGYRSAEEEAFMAALGLTADGQAAGRTASGSQMP
jgi:hypothetical protein